MVMKDRGCDEYTIVLERDDVPDLLLSTLDSYCSSWYILLLADYCCPPEDLLQLSFRWYYLLHEDSMIRWVVGPPSRTFELEPDRAHLEPLDSLLLLLLLLVSSQSPVLHPVVTWQEFHELDSEMLADDSESVQRPPSIERISRMSMSCPDDACGWNHECRWTTHVMRVVLWRRYTRRP